MILAICYGNPLRGDDGMGWEMARRLKGIPLPAHTRIEVRQQLTPELAEAISRAERVVFVDARAGGTPGEATCTRLHPAKDPLYPLGHALGPEALLSLCRKIYGEVPEAAMFSVAGRYFGLGDGFSPEVAQALPALLARLRVCLSKRLP